MKIGKNQKGATIMAKYHCNVCGQDFEADAATECPICGAPADALEEV